MSLPPQTSLPSPTLSHASTFLQSYSKFPESYSKFPLAIYFTYGSVYASCYFLQSSHPLLPPLLPLSKASILWHSAFFMIQLSHLYMTTGKTTGIAELIFLMPEDDRNSSSTCNNKWLTFSPSVCTLVFTAFNFLVIMFLSASKFYKSKIIPPFGEKILWALYASERSHPIKWIGAHFTKRNTCLSIIVPNWKVTVMI